ncbi:MAG TPA: site-specific integrase [Ignavibacteria bacterium]|nr:site-specific integrase [Ignavibacteria bacterium]
MYLSKHRNGYYYIYFQDESGRRKSISTKTKLKSEAAKFLSEFKDHLQQRKDSKTIPVSIQHFITKFLIYSSHIHSENHTKSLRTTLIKLLEYSGDINLNELQKQKVISFIEWRLSKVSNRAVKRDIANLSSAFNWAIEKNFLSASLTKGIRKPKIVEKLLVYFTEAEYQTLKRVIDNEDIKDIVEFGLLTGVRQNDLINLTWQQIDFKNSSLILDNRNSRTKSGKVHSLPLSISALRVLHKRELNKAGDLVFTSQGERFKQWYLCKRFREYITKAGLSPQLSFHSLRHTFASWLIQKGVPLYVVSKLLTHSDLRTTQIYSHLKQENLSESVNLLSIENKSNN